MLMCHSPVSLPSDPTPPLSPQAAELWQEAGLGDMPPAPKHPRDPLRLLPNPPAIVGLFAQWEATVVELVANRGISS